MQSHVTHIIFQYINSWFIGEYADFDENELTSKSGGKSQVIQELKNKHHYSKIIMIGDGMTDAEACPPADAFIGNFSSNFIFIKMTSL